MQNPAGGYEYVINLVIVEFGMAAGYWRSPKSRCDRGHQFSLAGHRRNPVLKVLGLDEARKGLFNDKPTTGGGLHDH